MLLIYDSEFWVFLISVGFDSLISYYVTKSPLIFIFFAPRFILLCCVYTKILFFVVLYSFIFLDSLTVIISTKM